MATILRATKPEPKGPEGERQTFPNWLAWEMRDRNCQDAKEFARRYGFVHKTVWSWLSGRSVPSMHMCRELASLLDLTVLEVVCAAGHLDWEDIDEYTRAYADQDALGNWATTGDL